MRGKERFSAPRNSLDSIMRFSAGNASAVLYGLYRLRKTRFESGPDFKVVTSNANENMEGCRACVRTYIHRLSPERRLE